MMFLRLMLPWICLPFMPMSTLGVYVSRYIYFEVITYNYTHGSVLFPVIILIFYQIRSESNFTLQSDSALLIHSGVSHSWSSKSSAALLLSLWLWIRHFRALSYLKTVVCRIK